MSGPVAANSPWAPSAAPRATSVLEAAPAAANRAATYTDPAGLAALKGAPNSPATLHAVAKQVEALFLQMMLKSMRDASDAAGVPESNERGMYEDMFDKQVALTLSRHQDLGFTRLLERQLGGGSPTPAAGAAALPPPVSRAPVDSDRSPAARAGGPADAEAQGEFIRQILPPIRRAAQALGVSPLGLLAQAALETGWGRRIPSNPDGSSSLNLFGIKAGSEWRGPRVLADTIEFGDGVAQRKRTAFRAYGSIEESVGDFARLLASSPRYREAVDAGASAERYVAGIAQAGYASDPQYGTKLSQILNSGTLRSLARRTLRL